MRHCWMIFLCLSLVACGKEQTSAPASQAQSQGVSTPSPGLVPTPPRDVPPVVYEKPDRSGKVRTRLHLKPQPAPTYQKPGPARSVSTTPGQPGTTAPGSSTPPGPDTAALFGVRKPAAAAVAPHVSAPPSPPVLPPELAKAQQQAYQAFMAKAPTSWPPQPLAFADCTKRLQGSVAGNPQVKLVQNDASGYAVEMTVGNRIQRMTCDARTNTVSFSMR